MKDYPAQRERDGGWGGDERARAYVYTLQEGVSVCGS